MASRNDLVYDEDDYVPPGYVPPKPSSRGSKPLVVAVVLGLVIGAIAVVFVMRNRERARFARIERARAAQANTIMSNRLARTVGQAAEEVREQPSEGWRRIQGIWSRTPGRDEVIGYPTRFEFFAGRSAIVTQSDNRTFEMRIAIRREGGDSIELEAVQLVEDPATVDGQYRCVYHFIFKSDDTIVLDEDTSGLVFARVRVPANPARLGMPPR